MLGVLGPLAKQARWKIFDRSIEVGVRIAPLE
jgi:hypothetical protein